MPTKKTKKIATVTATRAVSKLDLTKPLKVSAAAAPRSKSDVFSTIADHAGLHRRDVAAVFHALGSLIKADLSKSGSGVFKVPGMMRITVTRKPATKARMGINPFTKEEVMFKAKPARNVVRVRPLRGLKEMV
jgi:nucleoid DNA-binding protein